MSADEHVNIEAQLSAIEARARVRRRRSAFLTFIPVALTGAIVLAFASDIAKKRTEVTAIEQQKKKLDAELRDKQEKLDKAEEVGQELDAKIDKLKEERRVLEDYVRGLRSKTPGATLAGAEKGPDSVVLTAEGEASAPLRVFPRATVTPRPAKGSYEVTFSLDVQEGDPNSISEVIYEPSSVYYFVKTEVKAYTPPFEGKLRVFACKSTVEVKVFYNKGSVMKLDFDWCKAEGWPPPKQEEVEAQSELQPRNPSPPSSLPGEIVRPAPRETPRSPPILEEPRLHAPQESAPRRP